MKRILLPVLLLISSLLGAQTIVINEVDADNPSTDTKEFIELLTSSPNMALDGYVVVLYNGSDDQSYEAFDLDGYSSDANGLFVLGTSGVSPTPNYVFAGADNVVQNGADAVAIYQDDADNFPNDTPITTANLIDVFVYGTGDSDDTGLLSGFGVSIQYDEDANGDKDNHSNQRKADGTFEAKTPTPGALNDGGGVQSTTITISTVETIFTEGDVFDITFTTSDTVTSDLVINYTLDNANFDSNDYTGSLTATIVTGDSVITTTITLVDDSAVEGNENLILHYISLDSGYQATNDDYEILIHDNDSSTQVTGTIVINEVDADNPSTDTKEFIELLTSSPNMALDGYVVVLYNGSDDQSYEAFDLDGYSSDANGLFVLGTSGVSPTPNYVFAGADNVVQNGADAVAIYQDDADNFPNDTPITTANLIDVFVYGTGDSDDTGLLSGFGVSIQYDEDANGDKDNHSNQRKADGTFEAKTPTPGALNDGGGVQSTTITISTVETIFTEGDVFDITFTTSDTVTSDLVINYTLDNANFDSNDYTGSLTATIVTGDSVITTTITLVDDSADEGDEILIVKYLNLAEGYQAINDNYEVKIIDNDFETSDWGSPLAPTFGIVSSSASGDYYSSLDDKSGQELKDAITAIIANPSVVRAQTYGDVWDILKEADQNPLNNQEIWLLYSEIGRSKLEQQSTGTTVGKWNREHIYPQSRGGFADGTSTTADGIDVFMATDATHTEHGHSDAHDIRPADPAVNSSRSNSDYGEEYDGPSGNKGSWKGDVARSVMFMALRYDELDVVSGNPDNTTVGELGDLDSLLVWHATDIPDDYEMNRNNVIFNWQKNRNPFIDLPELVDYVFGTKSAEIWNSSTSINDYKNEMGIYPNPVLNELSFERNVTGVISVINMVGVVVLNREINSNKVDLSNLSSGLYIYRLKTTSNNYQGKIIKK